MIKVLEEDLIVWIDCEVRNIYIKYICIYIYI